MNEELAAGQTPAPAEPNPLHRAVANNVRVQSKTEGQPTKLEIVDKDEQLLDSAAIVAILEEMEAQPDYEDIAHIVLPNGDVHVYSRRHVTDAYARLCARVLAGDVPAMIAATVREDSELYPRPTPIATFLEAPYLLKQSDIDEALAYMAKGFDFLDIHTIKASTGATYLYSNRHMETKQAESLVQWEEVGRHENP